MSDFINKRLNLHQQLQENQDRIQTLEKEIHATQKLASLGTIACLAAHEFKNFLVPIINWAELALQNPHDKDLTAKALRKAVKQGNMASEILQRMLGFAREQSDKPETIFLADLLDDCFLCLTRDFSKDGITVKKDVPKDLTLNAYQSQLQQVLINLLINARHAMLQRGGILTVTGRDNGETVTIAIKDSGCGIEEDVIGQIFEPFFSTKDSGLTGENLKGNGLGLSVCKSIIEDHHGKIEVQSQVGKGTTFTINLPAEQPAAIELQPVGD